MDKKKSALTLRKVGLFGCSNNSPDFEWPKAEDIESFSSDRMQLKGFKWKDVAISSYRSICALQLLFCDGTESPIFLAKDTNSDNLQIV